jgi:small nuclear ribonucleoprotein (snRNP)-like protein
MTRENRDKNENRHDQPIDILMGMANQQVYVRLVDRTELVGRLLDFDQYMNLKIGLDEEDILVRGNNVMLIADSWEDLKGPQTKAGKPA